MFTNLFNLNLRLIMWLEMNTAFSSVLKFCLLTQLHCGIDNFSVAWWVIAHRFKKCKLFKYSQNYFWHFLLFIYWKFLDSWDHQKWQLTINCIFSYYRFKEKYWLQTAFKTPGNVMVVVLRRHRIWVCQSSIHFLIWILEGLCEGLQQAQ